MASKEMGCAPACPPSVLDKPNELLKSAPFTVTLLKPEYAPPKLKPFADDSSFVKSWRERLMVGNLSSWFLVMISCAVCPEQVVGTGAVLRLSQDGPCLLLSLCPGDTHAQNLISKHIESAIEASQLLSQGQIKFAAFLHQLQLLPHISATVASGTSG